MRRSPEERITNDLARDIGVRESQKALLGGAIARLGNSYAIELKASNCQTGTTLAREQAEAADKEHVLPALAKTAQGMRVKLGESLASIESVSPPANWQWNATTGSLEALQDFYAGAQFYAEGRLAEAVSTLQRATELDPNLAFAWFWLAKAYYASGGRKRYQEYFDRAWALRDRVSAYERLWITSQRDGQTTGQYIESLETWTRIYPRDTMPPYMLGVLYRTMGEFEKSLAEFREADRRGYAHTPLNASGLMTVYHQLDRYEEAKAVAENVIARGNDGPMLRWHLLATAYAQADLEAASKQIEWFTGKPDEYRALASQSVEARTRGELRKSRELLQRAANLARLRNLPEVADGFLKPDAGGEALIGNCGPSRKTGAVSSSRFEDHTDYPVQDTSDAVFALCGNPALAARAEELNKECVGSIYKNPAQVPLTRAAVQLGLGYPEKAMELLQSVTPYESAHPMSNYIRGLAFLRLKKGDEAAAEFQKILDHRGANWGPLYPLSYVGVARGAVLAGDTDRARKGYENFFALWRDADPDVPILIQARQESARLSRLVSTPSR